MRFEVKKRGGKFEIEIQVPYSLNFQIENHNIIYLFQEYNTINCYKPHSDLSVEKTSRHKDLV